MREGVGSQEQYDFATGVRQRTCEKTADTARTQDGMPHGRH
jgi:hypothetical protein